MLAATPARQRSVLSQSHPPSSARSRGTTRTVEVPELPEYQPPEAPLTAEAHRQLATLQNSAQLRNLKTHLEHTAEKLTVSASDVNDRLFDARLRYEKQRQRQRDAGEDVPDDEDNGELQQLAEQERKVEEVTGQMEVKMRQMIDSEARLQDLLETVQNIDREEGEAQSAASRAGQARGQRRRTRQDDEGDDDDERDEYHETTPEREIRERNARNPPSRRLDTSLGEGVDKWNELSLTERCVDVFKMRDHTGRILTRWTQVCRPQFVRRVLSRCARLQIPKRGGPPIAALLDMVLAPRRYKRAS